MHRDKIEQRGRAEQDRVTHDPWEEAYLRFETLEQEIRKFIRRLRFMEATE